MDIKSQLKAAREAIKNKDFVKSSNISKSILNEDENNYLALVFLGLSIQECNPSKETEKIFRRAIKIDPENLLAWNGLANYYEKLDTTEARLELIKVYTLLIGKETNEKKLTDYCEKLCALYKYTNVDEICRVIYEKVEYGNFSEATLTKSRTSLANMLNQSNELSDDILGVYEDILSSLISSNETATTDYYSQYLTVLYKQRKFDILITHVLKMYEMFPEDIMSLSWICKLHNEMCVENKPSLIAHAVNIDYVYEKLLNLEPQNAMAMFTKAICEVQNEEYSNAKETLLRVVSLRAGLLHAWILLTRVNIVLHSYNDAATSANFANKLLKSPKCPCNHVLKVEIPKMLMEALSRSSDSSNWKDAIEKYGKLDDKSKEICLPHYTRANIKLGNTLEAKKSLTLLEKTTRSVDDLSLILRSQLLRKQGKHIEALAFLEEHKSNTSEWFLEVGITYWEMRHLDNCLLPLLKATKLDPNNHYCFFYLGNYYRELKEYNKARQCYQKSYKLCPSYSEAAMELSKIYRKLKNWASNIDLLRTITKDVITKENMWAGLQMGLNLMEQGDYENAVKYLRRVSRVDPDNAHCWEALADAYFSTGAYTSAQKAYKKVLELSEDAMYPALQIAIIKKDLGNLHESLADFEALLRRNRNCILTLTGLAETCLKTAKQCYLDQRLGTSRDYAQYAAEAVTRAIQQCSEVACLWKILGDCCMLVTQLPEKYCCLMIMRAVDEGVHVNGDKILEKDDLFQLAARCYCKALLLLEDNHLIWHDLAACYLSQAKISEDKEIIQSILARAQAIVHHCTSINPNHWQHWNLLGNIAVALDPPNYALAQHAFIRAVFLDNNCAVAWTNLGVLYLKKDDIKLANQAFAQAQRADPDYAQSWIGQGLLAEIIGQDEDAMDLFRHSTSLGYHPQSALGYGHWVCRHLMESPFNSNSYVIHKLHAIPVACDALTWYTESNPYYCCAWNMLGILKERMGLISVAAESFRKALNLSTQRYGDLARINYGRVLTRLGRYKEAIKICSDVQESSFNSGIWYALALYKDRQFQESSSIYLAVAQYLAKDKFAIGDVVACMAIITYVLGDPDLAKQTIIESFTQRLPTARAMYAFIALGVLQTDPALVALTLKQVEMLEDVPKSIEDFITLLSYVHIYQGNHMKAIRKSSELVHLLPDKSGLWLTLALTMLHSLNHLNSPFSSVHSANKTADLALKSRDPKAAYQKISKILCTKSVSSSLIQDRKSALISAQKAVHCAPNVRESWMVLNESLEWFSEKQSAREMTAKVLGSDKYEHLTVVSIF